MSRHYRERLPSGFPTHLLDAATDLAPLDINELAWPYPLVLEVVNGLADHGQAILGGDVFRSDRSAPEITGDSWYVERNQGLPWLEYVKTTAHKARQYIETYHARNGDAFLYSVVFAPDLDWLPTP